MVGVLVRTEIDASPDEVWSVVRRIEDHVVWMEDAVSITFTSARRAGVDTTFDCETRIGPLALTDRMEITEWVEGALIGVRHTGVVSGQGRFTLAASPDGGTIFTWDESLRFPWWLGGPLGGGIGAWILRRVWHRNLANLALLVSRGRAPGPGVIARSSSLRRR